MRRLLTALGLALLSPLIGEYLLGNISIRELAAIPFLAPMYGGGALLIRELARRTGRGWPTILVLGLAYGLIEPGVFDGSLFSTTYEGIDYSGARIPVLGVSAYYGLQFVLNHAVWSITIPILLTESLTRRELRTAPWLGRIGLGVTVVVYVLGGLLIRSYSIDEGQYPVTPARAGGVLIVALVLVVVALRLPRTAPAPARADGWVPRPWLVALAAFLVSTGYLVLPASWPGVAGTVTIVAATAWTAGTLSRRGRWHPGHRMALAIGALLTYAWAGFLLTALKHHADPVAFAGNALIAATVLALTALATRRALEPTSRPRRSGPRDGSPTAATPHL